MPPKVDLLPDWKVKPERTPLWPGGADGREPPWRAPPRSPARQRAHCRPCEERPCRVPLAAGNVGLRPVREDPESPPHDGRSIGRARHVDTGWGPHIISPCPPLRPAFDISSTTSPDESERDAAHVRSPGGFGRYTLIPVRWWDAAGPTDPRETPLVCDSDPLTAGQAACPADARPDPVRVRHAGVRRQ